MNRLTKTTMAALVLTSFTAGASSAGEITIATINNGHMITMQELTPTFEAANLDIKSQMGDA